jgi:hypothetical protein
VDGGVVGGWVRVGPPGGVFDGVECGSVALPVCVDARREREPGHGCVVHDKDNAWRQGAGCSAIRDMTATDVVRDFAARLRICVDELASIWAADLDGRKQRSGHIPGVGDWSLHGAGCLVVMADGALVDSDWNTFGEEVFDAWRINQFERSVGLPETEPNRLIAAARSMCADGSLVEASLGWFRLID